MNANNSNYITEADESKPPQPKAEHTPAPWSLNMDTHSPAPWIAKRVNAGKVMINLPGDGSIAILGYNTENNARLIAQAPAMLEALKDILKWMDDNPPAKGKKNDLDATYRNACFYRERETARTIIAKAKGE